MADTEKITVRDKQDWEVASLGGFKVGHDLHPPFYVHIWARTEDGLGLDELIAWDLFGTISSSQILPKELRRG